MTHLGTTLREEKAGKRNNGVRARAGTRVAPQQGVNPKKLVGVLGVMLAAACSSQPEAAGGEGGAPAEAATDEGGGAATEQAGAGGEGVREPGKLQDATEHGLTQEDVVTDPAELDGRSFTLTGSLCPSESWPPLIGGGFDHGLDSMPGFSLRLNDAGELELVSFTRAHHDLEALARVQVTSLTRAGLGFDASNVKTCARESYFFEDEFQVEEYRAGRLHVVFERGSDGGLSAKLAATTPGATPAVSSAEVDSVGPEIRRSVDLPLQYLGEQELKSLLHRAFVLSEPAALDSRLEVVDRDGAPVMLEPELDAGFIVGFLVKDVLSDEAHFNLELRDIAGNTTESHAAYPGVSWPPTAGDFEGDAHYETTESLGPYGDSCSAGLADELDGAPALAGKQSLAVNGNLRCQTFVRVARPAGTHKMLLDVRRMHEPNQSGGPLGIVLHSLGAGDDGIVVSDKVSWAKDPQLSSAEWEVSEVETLSVVLPPTGEDFVLELQPEDDLMVDSLRFE